MKTIGNGSNYSPQFLVYGDFGYDNAQSMTLIKEQVNGGAIDAILHIGDFAYDLFSVSSCQYQVVLKKEPLYYVHLDCAANGQLNDVKSLLNLS